MATVAERLREMSAPYDGEADAPRLLARDAANLIDLLTEALRPFAPTSIHNAGADHETRGIYVSLGDLRKAQAAVRKAEQS